VVLCAASPQAPGQGTPIGFEETFALASDRGAALDQLIPGTRDYYFYKCLHLLNRGALACLRGDARAAVDAWNRDGDRLPAALFAAVAAFAQGRVLDTPFSEEFGKYGYSYGMASEREKRTEDAIAWYSFSLAYAPNTSTASRLARLYHAQKRDDLAESAWRRVADALPPTNPDYWQALAHLAEMKKEWAVAAEDYEESAMASEPDQAYYQWLRAGDFWSRVREYGRAESACRQALALHPEKVDAYLRIGHLYRYRKQYGEAVAWYRKAQSVAPENYAPAYYLGIAARDQHEYEKALSWFDRALELRPGNAWVLYYKAVTLAAIGRRGEAAQTMERAILAHSGRPASWQKLRDRWMRYPTEDVDPDHWWTLGRAAEKEKNWAKAASLYRKGASLAYPPDDYRLLSREALMHRYLKEWDESRSIYAELIRRYPGRADAYLGMGETFRVKGEYNAASMWFQKARKIAPESYAPPYYLGLVARAQKRYQDAVDYFDASLALRANNSGALYYKAVSLKALGRRDAAIRTLEKALALYKTPPKSWQNLLKKWKAEYCSIWRRMPYQGCRTE
jgi:tetratricopeptide (TPR) repeat protein